jgi:hypothetical protein
VVLFIFQLDFGTVPTVWHHLLFNRTLELFRECGIIGFSFFYWTLELFRLCGIICFSIGLWNCSDNMALFISLMDFEAVPAVWHYLFFYGIWNFSESLALLVFHFYSGLWNCSDSVTLLVFLLGFGRVPTVWHHLLFNRTLELFRE